MRSSAAVFLLALLAGCGSGYDDFSAATDEARLAVYEENGSDSDGAEADASSVDAYDVEDSGNYVCTEDCSGHEAGFAWAQENDVTDASDCGGNSQSFIEGCEAFAEERQEQADQAVQEAVEDVSYEAEAEADRHEDDSWR